jgi:hypothetical protein
MYTGSQLGTEIRKKCVNCGELKYDEHPKGKFFHTSNLYILGWWCDDCLKKTSKEDIQKWVEERTREAEGKYDKIFQHYREHRVPGQDE